MNSLMKSSNDAGGGSVIPMERSLQSSKFLRAKRRSLEQNRLMWSMCTDLAEQVKWPVDGVEQFLAKEDWKTLATAGLWRDQRIAAGLTGGFVMLGRSTSNLSVPNMNELLEFLRFFGDSKQVVWSDSPGAA